MSGAWLEQDELVGVRARAAVAGVLPMAALVAGKLTGSGRESTLVFVALGLVRLYIGKQPDMQRFIG